MCWSTKCKKNTKPRKSSYDIPVYKVLLKNNSTPYMLYPVSFNTMSSPVHINIINIPENPDIWSIDKGYHSYSAQDTLLEKSNSGTIVSTKTNCLRPYFNFTVIHKAYIPKNTIFFENEHGEVVSETLVVTPETITPILSDAPISVILNDDGEPRMITIPYNKLQSYTNIIGLPLYRFPYSSTLICASLLKTDWQPESTPKTGLPKSLSIFSDFGLKRCSYGFNCLDNFTALVKLFDISEMIGNDVDWFAGFYNDNIKQIYHLRGGVESGAFYNIPFFELELPKRFIDF